MPRIKFSIDMMCETPEKARAALLILETAASRAKELHAYPWGTFNVALSRDYCDLGIFGGEKEREG